MRGGAADGTDATGLGPEEWLSSIRRATADAEVGIGDVADAGNFARLVDDIDDIFQAMPYAQGRLMVAARRD